MSDISSPKRSFGGNIIAVLVGLILFVFAAEFFFRVATPNWSEYSIRRILTQVSTSNHAQITIGKPNYNGFYAHNTGDFRIHISVNEFGSRNSQPVSSANGQLWTFGDSMTFGLGVEAPETYAELFESSTNLGVYNFSAPAGDICSYQIMADRIPKTLKPKAVIVGLFLENDTVIKSCPTQFSKTETHKSKTIIPNGLSSLLSAKNLLTKYSALYIYIAISIKKSDLLKQFLIEVGLVAREHDKISHSPTELIIKRAERTTIEVLNLRQRFPVDTPFVVLLIPARHDIRDGDQYFKELRNSVVRELRKSGIPVTDPFAQLKAAGFKRVHFVHDGHWTRVGHKIAASVLANWFKTNEPNLSTR